MLSFKALITASLSSLPRQLSKNGHLLPASLQPWPPLSVASWFREPRAPVTATSCIPLHTVLNQEVEVNAGESVHSVARMRALASTITLVRRQFPAAQANLSPWRDDPQTRQWSEEESLDFSFHFPGSVSYTHLRAHET